MAEWSFQVGDAATVKRFSYRLFAQSIQSTLAMKLAQVSSSKDSPDNIVQILDDTQKGEGDQIKYDLIGKLSGAGTAGDNEISGNAESLNLYQDSILIDQLRHAVLIKGAMSQQRVPFSMREQARLRLADWWLERFDLWLINQLTGLSTQADTKYTGMNATVAPDAAHMLFANGRANETLLVAGDSFTLDMIDEVVSRAHTYSTPIKPIRLKGMEIFGVLLLHPYQVRSLRQNYTAGQWGDIQRAAMEGGQISGNPIFTGAIGMYGNVVIHSDARIPYGSAAQRTATLDYNTLGIGGAANGGLNIARGVFCGAQAACMAFGRAYGEDMKAKWVEELLDANNQLQVTAGFIGGVKKTRFNSADYATMTVSSFESE